MLLSLSNTVQNAIIGEDNTVSGGIIGAFTLLLVNYVVVRFLFGHRRLDQIVEGKSAVLMKEGRICKEQLAKELITIAELQTVVRRQGLEGLHEVETCVLEPGGGFVGLLPQLDHVREHLLRLLSGNCRRWFSLAPYAQHARSAGPLPLRFGRPGRRPQDQQKQGKRR